MRANGGVRVVIGPTGRGSAALSVAERGGFCVRFPRPSGACEGVLVNTGGGLTGGDRMALDAAVRSGAEAVLTTQSAEKIYRSDGADTEVTLRLAVESHAQLDWLPQEQILFDGARLSRTLEAAVSGSARLLLVESTVFGRTARAEVLATGAFRDRWRIRRDGRLILAESVCLEGAIGCTLARPAVAGGANAVATVLLVAPDAESRRDDAREALAGAGSECGVTAWNGMLLARFLSHDGAPLRADLARFLHHLRGRPLPRSWQT